MTLRRYFGHHTTWNAHWNVTFAFERNVTAMPTLYSDTLSNVGTLTADRVTSELDALTPRINPGVCALRSFDQRLTPRVPCTSQPRAPDLSSVVKHQRPASLHARTPARVSLPVAGDEQQQPGPASPYAAPRYRRCMKRTFGTRLTSCERPHAGPGVVLNTSTTSTARQQVYQLPHVESYDSAVHGQTPSVAGGPAGDTK